MNKISKAEAVEVLSQVPETLRRLSEENRELREKVAHYEKLDTAQDLVAELEGRGHDVEGVSAREKAANLVGSGRDLGVLRAAMDLERDGSSFQVGREEGRGGANPETEFESAIMG